MNPVGPPRTRRGTPQRQGAPKPGAPKRGAPKRVDMAYDEIKRRILTNEFAPNYQITESQLAEMLGVSRTPVHEALIRLEKEHLVEVIPRHGMRVLPVSPQEMLETYQVLTALESEAVLLLATHAERVSRAAALRRHVDQMDAALAQAAPRDWAQADGQFHRLLFELCGNTKLMQVGLSFHEQVDRSRLLTLPMRPEPVRSNQAHRELLDLIEQGDAQAAFACHRQHRQRVTEELTDVLKRFLWLEL